MRVDVTNFRLEAIMYEPIRYRDKAAYGNLFDQRSHFIFCRVDMQNSLSNLFSA